MSKMVYLLLAVMVLGVMFTNLINSSGFQYFVGIAAIVVALVMQPKFAKQSSGNNFLTASLFAVFGVMAIFAGPQYGGALTFMGVCMLIAGVVPLVTALRTLKPTP
jgi:hypothetical protein